MLRYLSLVLGLGLVASCGGADAGIPDAGRSTDASVADVVVTTDVLGPIDSSRIDAAADAARFDARADVVTTDVSSERAADAPIEAAVALDARVPLEASLFADAAEDTAPDVAPDTSRPSSYWLTAGVLGDGSYARISGMRRDANGRIFVRGEFGGTLSFPGLSAITSADTSPVSGHDAFVAAFSPEGTALWLTRISGGAGTDIIHDMLPATLSGSARLIIVGAVAASATDSINVGGTNLSVASARTYGIFASLDLDTGATVRADAYSVSRFSSVVQTSATDLAVGGVVGTSGSAFGVALTGATGTNGFVIRVPASGGTLFRMFEGTVYGSVNHLAVDPDGNLVIQGIFSGSADLGAGLTPAGGIVSTFYASYSNAGVYRWSKITPETLATSGGGHPTGVKDLAITSSGSIRVSGQVPGTLTLGGGMTVTASAFVFSMSATTGETEWVRAYGETSPFGGPHMSRSMEATSPNQVDVTADIDGPGSWGGTAFAVGGLTLGSFDASGNHRDSRYITMSARAGGVARFGSSRSVVGEEEYVMAFTYDGNGTVFGRTLSAPAGGIPVLVRFP